MVIYRLLKTCAFDPEDVECLSKAYEDALRTLGLVERSDAANQLIARKIIEVAQNGERDPARIRALAIAELGRGRQRHSWW